MFTLISRFLNYSYGMIARLTHRTFTFLTGFRRALPWSSKPVDDPRLPSGVASANENQSLIESGESSSVSFPSSSTFETECELKTIVVTKNETNNTLNTQPTTKSEQVLFAVKTKDNTTKAPKVSFKSETSQELSMSKKRKHGDSKEASKAKKGKSRVDKDNEVSQQPPRPNYFVAIQVSNPEIMTRVQELQQKILAKEVISKVINKFSKTADIFKDTMVKKEKLHFTLHVFHLKDSEDKERAKSALENCYAKYKTNFEAEPMRLNIEGLGHFRNGVIFAKIQGTDHVSRLEALSEDIRKEFEILDILGDPKPFRPHLTIAKLSKSKTLAKKKIRSYPPEIWADFRTEHLGYQTVESLQLLSMMDTDPTTGYYGSIAQFDFLSQSIPGASANVEGGQEKDNGRKAEVDAEPRSQVEDHAPPSVSLSDSNSQAQYSGSSVSVPYPFENSKSKRDPNSDADDYIGIGEANSMELQKSMREEDKESGVRVIHEKEAEKETKD